MEPFSVESWLASENEDVWTGMMKRVRSLSSQARLCWKQWTRYGIQDRSNR